MEEAPPPPPEGLSLHVREDGVALLSLLPPAGRPNLVTPELLAALDERVAEVEEGAREGLVRALIVRSGRPGTFVAGVDLVEILRLRSAAAATEQSRYGQRVFRRLEQLEIPTVAAIDGACLGSGLELALACGYRIASTARGTRLGLPHVRIGITPAFGGTVRLPRLVGLQAALDLILTGRSLGASEALEIGLVDDVVAPAALDERALAFAHERLRHGRLRARRGLRRRLLEETAPGRRLILRGAARQIRGAGAGHAPTARLALEGIARSYDLTLDEAFAREAALAGELLVGEPARALVHASLAARTGRGAPAAPPPRRAAVLGAGEVGLDLAGHLLAAGLQVRLRDRRKDALALGVQRILSRIAEARLAERLGEAEAERRVAALGSGTGYGGFGTLDLVVAAEGEGEPWVRAALREAADHTQEGCVLAYASPLLSPDELQGDLPRPERVVGINPSLPGDRFPLVEIAPGALTSRSTLDAALALVRRMGRIGLVVRPAPATPATRLLGAYLDEALRLLQEGAAIAQVDRAAESFGFAMGPLRRLDALGARRGLRYLQHLEARFASLGSDHAALLDRVIDSGGFYLPAGRRGPQPNPTLSGGVPDGGVDPLEGVRTRLLLRLVNEASHLLRTGAVGTPREIELVSLAGLGFPRLRGGLLFHADGVGVPEIVRQMTELETRFGPRFAPDPLLEALNQTRGALLDVAPEPSGHPASSML